MTLYDLIMTLCVHLITSPTENTLGTNPFHNLMTSCSPIWHPVSTLWHLQAKILPKPNFYTTLWHPVARLWCLWCPPSKILTQPNFFSTLWHPMPWSWHPCAHLMTSPIQTTPKCRLKEVSKYANYYKRDQHPSVKGWQSYIRNNYFNLHMIPYHKFMTSWSQNTPWIEASHHFMTSCGLIRILCLQLMIFCDLNAPQIKVFQQLTIFDGPIMILPVQLMTLATQNTLGTKLFHYLWHLVAWLWHDYALHMTSPIQNTLGTNLWPFVNPIMIYSSQLMTFWYFDPDIDCTTTIGQFFLKEETVHVTPISYIIKVIDERNNHFDFLNLPFFCYWYFAHLSCEQSLFSCLIFVFH